jgi:hypothetical protein
MALKLKKSVMEMVAEANQEIETISAQKGRFEFRAGGLARYPRA